MSAVLRPVRLPLPPRAAHAGLVPPPVCLYGVGHPALLDEPLLGLLASRNCPGRLLLDTLEEIPAWVRAGRVILSGFHSPLEQQVLRSVLRRHGRVVKVLARGLNEYHPPELELEPLEQGRMLVLSPFPEQLDRTTRETSLARNRLVLALATDLVIPHVSPNGGLAAVVAGMRPDWPETSVSLTNYQRQ